MARLALALACAAALLAGCASGGSSGASSWPNLPTSALTGTSASSHAAVAPAIAARPKVKARAKPKPVNHCAKNTVAQLVQVSIRSQHAWMCAKTRTVFQTAVTTGMSGADTSTPTGNFRIQGRDRNTVLTLNTGAQYAVKYWIPFSAPLYGFHDSSWQHFTYGSPKYRTAGSHGCVHMPLKAMAFLYRWADLGADVHIH